MIDSRLNQARAMGIEGFGWAGYMVHSHHKPLLGLVREGSKEEIVVRQIAQRLVGATGHLREQKQSLRCGYHGSK